MSDFFTNSTTGVSAEQPAMTSSAKATTRPVIFWLDRRISELTREQLIDALEWCASEIESLRADRDRWMKSGDPLKHLMAGRRASTVFTAPDPVKQATVLLSGCRWRSGFWFRVCGYGLHLSLKADHVPLFSERYGSRKACYLGPFRFKFLRPN